MKCDRARELLSAALDGELEPAEAEALDRHLAACEACGAERDRLAAVRTAFRSLTPAAPPRDLAGLVMERIRAGEAGEPAPSEPAPAIRRWRVARLAAALALLTIGLGAAWLSRASDAPAAPPVAPARAAAASLELGADAGCEADGNCLHLAPCDSPMECGGGAPCSNPGECGGAVDQH